MFTGIVQDLGRLVSRETRGVDARITIATERLKLANVAIGDSICVQGVCLTVTSLAGNAFTADVSHETLSLTTLGELQVNAQVNVEPSLRAGDPLGGHLVSGHVDGVARVSGVAKDGDSLRVTFDAPRELARYIARKGSVAVDGVSLTVNEVAGTTFGVSLIPHTQSVTTLGRLQVGARVNLEVDPIARYVERLSQMS
ncbi:MAG TPA: riboflavin synthase [Steroidobacteraceae bacterium]|nr:riboflavin synthase [Steroidobacteraceae bacterium]